VILSLFFRGGATTHCAFPPPTPFILSDYSFFVHHPVNRDDRQLLAHAMASDFTVARQFSQLEFSVMDQTTYMPLIPLF
jgi:hypothetical protein